MDWFEMIHEGDRIFCFFFGSVVEIDLVKVKL